MKQGEIKKNSEIEGILKSMMKSGEIRNYGEIKGKIKKHGEIEEKIKKYGEIGKKLRNPQEEEEEKKLLRPLSELAVKNWRSL